MAVCTDEHIVNMLFPPTKGMPEECVSESIFFINGGTDSRANGCSNAVHAGAAGASYFLNDTMSCDFGSTGVLRARSCWAHCSVCFRSLYFHARFRRSCFAELVVCFGQAARVLVHAFSSLVFAIIEMGAGSSVLQNDRTQINSWQDTRGAKRKKRSSASGGNREKHGPLVLERTRSMRE